MAYDPDYLFLVRDGLSNAAAKEWELHTTDAIATVNTAAYIADGVSRGMAVGDKVTVVTRASLPDGAPSAWNDCRVNAVGLGTDGFAVDLTDGDSATSTDSD